MMRDMKLAMAIACVTAAAVSAQRGSEPAPGRIDTTTNGTTISVAGCLQSHAPGQTDATPPLPTPPPTAPVTPAQIQPVAGTPGFILINATVMSPPIAPPTPSPDGPSSARHVPPASLPGVASTENPHPSFLLEGREDDLRRQVGREVEVTGMLDVRTGVATPDATGPARPVDPSAATPPAPIPGTVATTPIVYTPRLHVNAVRVIASECRTK